MTTTQSVVGPLRELIDAALEVRDLLRVSPDMQRREHIPTGLRFVNAIDAAQRALSAAPAPSSLAPEAPARDMARHGVYVASRASAPERPAMWRRLRGAGHPIISTWIDEAGEGESHDLGDLWSRILREVTSAERLVLYAEAEDFPLKGAYVEVGMALAAGVPVYVVTPGVALDARSLRPLGSWAKHPLVTFCDTVEGAFAALTPRHEAPASDGE